MFITPSSVLLSMAAMCECAVTPIYICTAYDVYIYIYKYDDFFELSQQLMLNVLQRAASRYMDTPMYKKFSKAQDTVLDIGQRFVNKKMKELKEMADRGIDPADAQGL